MDGCVSLSKSLFRSISGVVFEIISSTSHITKISDRTTAVIL